MFAYSKTFTKIALTRNPESTNIGLILVNSQIEKNCQFFLAKLSPMNHVAWPWIMLLEDLSPMYQVVTKWSTNVLKSSFRGATYTEAYCLGLKHPNYALFKRKKWNLTSTLDVLGDSIVPTTIPALQQPGNALTLLLRFHLSSKT